MEAEYLSQGNTGSIYQQRLSLWNHCAYFMHDVLDFQQLFQVQVLCSLNAKIFKPSVPILASENDEVIVTIL